MRKIVRIRVHPGNGTTGGVRGPAEATPLDRVVYRSAAVTVAAFRCRPAHPAFSDSGPIQNHVFVFPRRSVRIRHEGQDAFFADPSVVTLYNRGQRYARSAVSPEGDACEWFAVEPGVLGDTIAAYDPPVRDRPQRPFRHAFAPCPPRAYLRQRALYEALRAGPPPDALAVEETVLALLQEVLGEAYAFWGRPPAARAPTSRQRDLAEAAKALLAERLGEAAALADLARALDVSPFHLCRTFKAATGSTLHAYRHRLRLEEALERVAAGEDLTGVALALGYSSHSHFTATFRRVFGLTPREARRRLSANRAERPAGGAGV
jgi:AraC-like DNA-binding protein